MSTSTNARPASVTFVVVLTWIIAILTVIAGIFLLLPSTATLIAEGVNPTTARTQGWVSVVLGLVIALFASALGHGSNFARLMISLLMMFRFVLGIVAVFTLWGTGHFWGALVVALAALLILYLLWNAKAAAFFSRR